MKETPVRPSEGGSEILVRRTRALAAVREIERQIVWISAPAGAGKTHLLHQLALESDALVLPFEIEARDVDPGRFFERFCAAVRAVKAVDENPRFGPDDVGRLRDFTARFLARLASGPADKVVVMLDDAHHLDAAPELLDALACAIERAAGNVAYVVASRTAAPPVWARLKAQGRLAQLEPESLNMDAEEVRALLLAHGDWRHGHDDALVAKLLEATCGWASGLGLLIELGKRRDAPFTSAEARDLVHESFSDQVLGAFSDEERELLMLLFPCERLYPDTLRETFDARAAELLERLHRRNVLVTRDYSRGDEREAPYRLHTLLRECLRESGLREIESGRLRAVSERLARSLLERGDADQAREIWLFSRDWSRLAGHLEVHAETLFSSGRSHSLARYLEAVPAEVRTRSTVLGFWHGLCLLGADPVAARRELSAAYERLRSGGGDPLATVRAWAALVDAIWFEWDDCTRLDRCIDDLPALVAMTEERPELRPMLVKGAFAALSLRDPGRADFAGWEADNLQLFQGRLSKSERITRGLQLVIHYVYGSGERVKAEIVLARLRQIYDAELESASDHCAYWVVNTAYAFWFAPEADAAPALASTGLAVTERLGWHALDVPLLNAALFRLASDEATYGVVNLLGLLDERLTADSRGNDLAIAQHFSAYLAWLEGEHDRALIAIELASRLALDSGFAISPLYYGLGRAAVLDSLERSLEALVELGRARRRAVAQGSRCMEFVACMIGAGIARRRGRAGPALRYLRRALALGAAERYRAVPWLRVAERERLCDLAVAHGIGVDCARALKRASGAARVEDGPELACCTLGCADIRRDGRSLLTRQKPQVLPLLLMLHLVVAGERGASGEQLIDAIWPDAGARAGRDRLKSTLYRLRRLLGDADAVLSTGGRVRIDPVKLSVDAWTLTALAEREADTVEEPVAAAERALELYRGGFVDLYSGHIDLLVYRERLALRAVRLVRRGACRLIERASWERAATLLDTALERIGREETLLDELHRCLEHLGRRGVAERLEQRWAAEA